ncbi:phosphopantetheine-binding protein [Hydrogenivirga sp. 128-5-R1-1]|uniref:acyl carrier protein n=1 Tax=Hydrogenivirga sp. 128-5-R1-1 TaxID=392423 RepID=UPI00015EF739|nr:phosphopantetheine-binding protein [Hydrogenivirga sp. 128-5-R1-1]EDP74915.1 acyl carrier protein [Hydrogenivirga sp. 128-5-R1-1]
MVKVEDIIALIGEIESLKDKVKSLDPSASVYEQGIDSLDMLSVFLAIQEKYGIDIPDEDIPNLTSIKDIVEYINDRKG